MHPSQPNKVKNENNEILKSGCLVLNDRNEVLIISEFEKGIWTFPKGHCESEETFEETAIREVYEETGCKVSIVKRLSDVRYINSHSQEKICVAGFSAKLISEDVSKREEGIEIRWVSIDEVKGMIFPTLKFLLDEIQ